MEFWLLVTSFLQGFLEKSLSVQKRYRQTSGNYHALNCQNFSDFDLELEV